MGKILVVENDKSLNAFVYSDLGDSGYVYKTFLYGKEAIVVMEN